MVAREARRSVQVFRRFKKVTSQLPSTTKKKKNENEKQKFQVKCSVHKSWTHPHHDETQSSPISRRPWLDSWLEQAIINDWSHSIWSRTQETHNNFPWIPFSPNRELGLLEKVFSNGELTKLMCPPASTLPAGNVIYDQTCQARPGVRTDGWDSMHHKNWSTLGAGAEFDLKFVCVSFGLVS